MVAHKLLEKRLRGLRRETRVKQLSDIVACVCRVNFHSIIIRALRRVGRIRVVLSYLLFYLYVNDVSERPQNRVSHL